MLDTASRTVDLVSHDQPAIVLAAHELLSTMIRERFVDRIALVSSFGVEAAVLLHLVAQVDVATPVLFLDTGMLFMETLRYRDMLQARLGLTDIRAWRPPTEVVAENDPRGELWRIDTDRCCEIRKVQPLGQALRGFDAWITGRKRFQGGERSTLRAIEVDADGRTKINPLATWTPREIAQYFLRHDLPRHPLEAQGFRSVGCMPCTSRTAAWEDARAGRWRHQTKTECGIHRRPLSPDDRSS